MTDSISRQILSRLSDEDFAGREVELARLYALARTTPEAQAHDSVSNALLLGAPRAGKTEILRKSFDRLFSEGGEALPFYYALQPSCLDPESSRVIISRSLSHSSLLSGLMIRRCLRPPMGRSRSSVAPRRPRTICA